MKQLCLDFGDGVHKVSFLQHNQGGQGWTVALGAETGNHQQ